MPPTLPLVLTSGHIACSSRDFVAAQNHILDMQYQNINMIFFKRFTSSIYMCKRNNCTSQTGGEV